MPSFVVDPILCTTPDEDEASALGQWLEALGGWLDAVERSPFEWKHVYPCTRVLFEVGRFPAFETLRRAQSLAGIDLNTGGLLRRITRFFQNQEHDIRCVTAAQCVVVEGGAPVIEPAALLARNLPEVRDPFTEGLLCLACDKAAGERFAADAHIVTLPLAGSAKEVAVVAAVGLVDPEQLAVRLKSATLDEHFPLVFSPEDLSRFHCEALLAGGEEKLSVLIRTIAGSVYAGSPLLDVTIGRHFWQSLNKTGILEDTFATGKLLRVCAGVIAERLDTLNVDRRPKRTTIAGDSPQQVRKSDKAKAWRLTITKAGAGYRLHYWHVPGEGEQRGQIELANVLRETDEPVIPER
jgi:hypothetical protein